MLDQVIADLEELNARARVALDAGLPEWTLNAPVRHWYQARPGGPWHALLGWLAGSDRAMLMTDCQPSAVLSWRGVAVTSVRPADLCAKCCGSRY